MKLIERDIPPRAVWALEQAGVHPLLARLFAARGVNGHDELDDGLARLLPPGSLKGAKEAAMLLADAIAADRAGDLRARAGPEPARERPAPGLGRLGAGLAAA